MHIYMGKFKRIVRSFFVDIFIFYLSSVFALLKPHRKHFLSYLSPVFNHVVHTDIPLSVCLLFTSQPLVVWEKLIGTWSTTSIFLN